MNHILDNFIAQGKAEPMIVVMPYANAYPALKKKGSNIQANLMSTDMFTNELLKEIIPYVQANYQTRQNGKAVPLLVSHSVDGRH